jgi:hypothetical protein
MAINCPFLAHSTPSLFKAATPTLSPTVPQPTSERGCGDGVCDESETAETCPADCEPATPTPTPTPTLTPTPIPLPSREASGSEAQARFGLDYIYPLQATYQDEMWPRLFAGTGMQWVNFAGVGWNAIEPNPPQSGLHRYKWEKLDRAIRVWQEHGFRIAVSLRLGNGWFAGPIKYRPAGLELKDTDRLPAEEYMDHYRAWITALVERYDGDGVDDMPGLRYPVLHYQVGNEYANPAFWTGTPEDYRVLLQETGEAARAAHRGSVPPSPAVSFRSWGSPLRSLDICARISIMRLFISCVSWSSTFNLSEYFFVSSILVFSSLLFRLL